MGKHVLVCEAPETVISTAISEVSTKIMMLLLH